MIVRFGLLQLLLVAATAYLAHKQGRNPATWAIAALFLPIVALVIVALLPPLDLPRAYARGSDTDGLVPVCAKCGRTASNAEARYCGHCGAPFGD